MFKKLLQKISTREKGKQAEDIAESFLLSKGYSILCRNFRCKLGEIDIIARKGKTLIFVEVKSNFSREDFVPEEKVDKKKKEKIFKTAEVYLLKNSKILSKIKEIRMDVIVVKVPEVEVKHYEGAFFREE